MMIRLIVFVLIISSLSALGQGFNKIEVAVLGTFHLGQSSDLVQGDVGDIFTRKRQKELKELRRQLARLRPQKIFVENTPEFQSYWDNVYENYQLGQFPKDRTVRGNEIFQIGIKLAAELKNTNGVHCVNYLFPSEKDIKFENTVEEAFAQYYKDVQRYKPNYDTFFKSNALVKSSVEDFLSKNKKWIKLPIHQHLYEMNKEENLRQLHYFNVLAWMDNNTKNMGADFTSLEYYRNLQIVQNVYKNLSPFDKRILIVIGAAHAQILTDMLESHPAFKVVPIGLVLE